ncbi:HAD-IC family P-type ATPase [Candidatus Phytoplasma australiense]|uniref:Putative cation-transporting ATPase exp7 n=1 Tax=Strawberry lethal yellows phytoplasma (CPA) str. NZSb11 TaxID=980422 RepID=R4S0T7_PHYAS|nr:HAD-IC family P-type ATPase [Candidatus Phytoplasma australiense]AGL90404.1 putative cation-transporting ATPase exp7 [Strawberry lethal yellows phytoplasma (CPA) str. NZSb11]
MDKNLNSLNITKGLTNKEVAKRKALGQSNVVSSKNSRSFKDILFNNFFNSLTLLILIVVLVIIYIGKYKQLFFLLVYLTNIFINLFQEIRAKKTLDKISLLLKTSSQVIREGQKETVAIADLVLGDFLVLKTGDQISADAKVKSGVIEVNEALLTGETQLIAKKEGDFLYSGSYVVSGQSVAEIVAVGSDMYIEKISQAAKKYKQPQTPLMKGLSSFIKAIIICLIFLFLASAYFCFHPVSTADNYKNSFLLGFCAMTISMLPLGLFLLVNITLAVGFINLAKQKAYAQNLFGIEMLAQINTLCLDKTGTITDGTMNVKSVIPYFPKDFPFEKIMASFLKAEPDSNHTHDALKRYFDQNTDFYPIKQNIPFSSVRKYSVVEFETLGTFFLGAPEFILQNNFFLIQKDFEKQVKAGCRVLLLAKNSTHDWISQQNTNQNQQKINNCIPLALIVIEDNIKQDAADTIAFFQKNGVAIKVISGDNHLTVSQIAQRVGVSDANKAINLENINDEEVEKIALKYNIFGRTTPQQKQILIRTLKKAGQKVAMTGDGVNDILALKEADLSIAMASGSQATRNISNLVLMDSNFSSMKQVVFEGRKIINNLDKVSILFFTKTIFSFLLSFNVIILNLFKKPCYYPIDPLKLQFIMDYWSIGIPSLLLSFEKNYQIIKGDFLKKNLQKAFPYAFLVMLSYLFIYCKLYSSDHVMETLEKIADSFILVATLVLFVVLWSICKPFNLQKSLLFILMLLFFSFFYFALARKSTTIFKRPSLILLLFVVVILSFLISFLNVKNFFNFQKFFNFKNVKKVEKKF